MFKVSAVGAAIEGFLTSLLWEAKARGKKKKKADASSRADVVSKEEEDGFPKVKQRASEWFGAKGAGAVASTSPGSTVDTEVRPSASEEQHLLSDEQSPSLVAGQEGLTPSGRTWLS